MEPGQSPAELPAGMVLPGPRDASSRTGGGHVEAAVVRDVLGGAGVSAVYQPIVDLRTRRVHGWEALVRGRHPVLGDVPPTVLVEAATRHQMLDDLTVQVAEQAMLTVAAAVAMTGETLRLALNIEIEQLRLDCDVVHWLLAQGRPPGVELLLELTERGSDEWTEEHEATACRLEASGIGLSLDDYGAGAARLGFLDHRDWALVKMDRRFLLGDTSRDRTILVHFAEMLRELGISRVIEGVETPAQLALVEGLGVEYAQGFLLGRPASADQLLEGLGRDGLSVRPQA